MNKTQRQNRGLSFLDAHNRRLYCAGCNSWLEYEECDIAQLREGDWAGEFFVDEEPVARFYWEITDELIAQFSSDNNLPLVFDTVILCRHCAAYWSKFHEHEPGYTGFVSTVEKNLVSFYTKNKILKRG
jgi:hypothetical protein